MSRNSQIICFRPPYPDETFHSICARISDYLKFPSKLSLVRKLFGVTSLSTSLVSFPTRIAYFVTTLPTNKLYTVDYFVQHHTLLPYCKPFSKDEQTAILRGKMQSCDGGNLSKSTVGPVQILTEFLRFCPKCVAQDRATFGECYWHRVHQINGIHLCPKHQVFLECSEAPAYTVGHTLLSAEQSVRQTAVRPIDPSSENHQLLQRLALGAEWLLENGSRFCDQRPAFYEKLRMLLARNGLATLGYRNRPRKLVPQFKAKYSNEVLGLIGLGVDKSDRTWLQQLTTSRLRSNPLEYLLLLDFFNYSIEEFFKLRRPKAPFGNGPWLCLNPVCEHFDKKVIHSCQVSYRKQDGLPFGTFRCSCGFEYIKKGSNRDAKDRFRIFEVLNYGSIWESEFRHLWFDPRKSKRDIARIFQFAYCHLSEHVERLGLPNRRPARHIAIRSALEASDTSANDLILFCRNEWLRVKSNYPFASVDLLSIELGWKYDTLRDNDRDWLKAHTPKQNPKKTLYGIEITTLDVNAAREIHMAATCLRGESGYPKRVAQATLLIRTCLPEFLSDSELRRLDKLPLVSQAISDEIDSRITYAIRRINWLTDKCLAEKDLLKRGDFISRLTLSEIMHVPEVEQELTKATRELQRQLGRKAAVAK